MPHRSYTAVFKLQVISYAEEHGHRAAGRKFDVDESNVRKWRRNKEDIKKMPSIKKARRGKKAQHPELEKTLLEWVEEKRLGGIAINTVHLRLQAKLIAKKMKLNQSEFKASRGWASNFMSRHNLSVRRRTHISQKLPADIEEKLMNFQQFIIKMRREKDYPLSLIGNADQTPLTFDMPADSTIDFSGTSSISIKTTGHEKNRFTVMLACMADGTKLKPYIIFKRKTAPKNVEFPTGIIVRFQQKGWMDDALFRDWIDIVWASRPGGKIKKDNSLLVLDAFRCHRSEDQLKHLKKQHKTDVAIIPGGMTSILQPLDVSVNKPFKNKLRDLWTEWMSTGEKSFTKGGRVRAPDLALICKWIVHVWQELDPQIIVHSFVKCCISSALDGSQDDVVWKDDITDSESSVDYESESDRDLNYNDADILTNEQMDQIFNAESDTEFAGFE